MSPSRATTQFSLLGSSRWPPSYTMRWLSRHGLRTWADVVFVRGSTTPQIIIRRPFQRRHLQRRPVQRRPVQRRPEERKPLRLAACCWSLIGSMVLGFFATLRVAESRLRLTVASGLLCADRNLEEICCFAVCNVALALVILDEWMGPRPLILGP